MALVAGDLDAACAAVEEQLGLAGSFHDPGVAAFGLVNAVYEIGDTFLEVVSPRQPGTTAGRYLDKRGGDAGYMAIFQVADTAAAREGVRSRGLRIVWQVDLEDISGTHLHPKDVPGAIVSFDTSRPAVTWRWAGPRWTGGTPDVGHRPGAPQRGISGLAVRLLDVESGAKTWAAVVDAPLDGDVMALDEGRQQVTFKTAHGPSDEGIASVEIDGLAEPSTICGVTFRPAAGSGDRP